MKKVFVILLLLLLVGCKKTTKRTYEKFELEVEENLVTTKTIDPEELERKINDKETFILLIVKTGCQACEAFYPEINKFISETHYVIYRAYHDRIKMYNHSINKDILKVHYTPMILVIIDGEVADFIDSNDNQDMFWENGYIDFIKKYISNT